MSRSEETRWFQLVDRARSEVYLFWVFSLAFVLEWISLAFYVQSREDWLLENVLVFIFAGPVVWSFLKGHLSVGSYACVIVFLLFHNVGAHYTYSLVPYNKVIENSVGVSIDSFFGGERNHYDRFVHFLWGLLIFLPIRELLKSILKIEGRGLTVFAFFTIIFGSTIYEIIEWLAALVFGGELGVAYLGTQGDVWDAQKDQVLAMSGALIALGLRIVSKSYLRKKQLGSKLGFGAHAKL